MRYQRFGALRQLKIGNRWLSLWWTEGDFRFHSWVQHIDGAEIGTWHEQFDGGESGE